MTKVHFTEAQSTMLATLYGRALDARLADPVLGDPTAEPAVRQVDYDFAKFKMNTYQAISVAMRAQLFDRWTTDFLRLHPEATVLHLGCGMDSRAFRIDPAPTVRWYDVDYPEVIGLREQIYPDRENYTTIASSVTDPGWEADVPADRPTLVVAEGLTYYLTPDGGPALLRRLADRFPGGEMCFDVYSRTGLKLQMLNPVLRRSGAKLSWGVEDPGELERLGLTLVECLDAGYFADHEVIARFPLHYKLMLRAAARIPVLRRIGRMLRYLF